MKWFMMMIAGIALTSVSCERHEFEGKEGTKQLHPAPHHQESGASHHGESTHK